MISLGRGRNFFGSATRGGSPRKNHPRAPANSTRWRLEGVRSLIPIFRPCSLGGLAVGWIGLPKGAEGAARARGQASYGGRGLGTEENLQKRSPSSQALWYSLCRRVSPGSRMPGSFSCWRTIPMGAPRRQSKSRPVLKSPKKALHPNNRRLLAFLEKLASRPDELGDAWWDEFRKSLRENRLRFRSPQDA